MPRVYIIDDSAPTPSRPDATRSTPASRSRPGSSRSSTARSSRASSRHELSHVRNYDIRFSLLVGVLVGSIALLADMIARAAFWGGMARGGRRERRAAAVRRAIIMVVGLVVAVLAPFFARLVQMAVSRQREFLADASSVELTRNPYGLERALAKIAADQEPLEVANRATQHLYIVNPIKKLDASARGLFSTHPAIVDRINRLRRMTGQPDSTMPASEGARGAQLSPGADWTARPPTARRRHPRRVLAAPRRVIPAPTREPGPRLAAFVPMANLARSGARIPHVSFVPVAARRSCQASRATHQCASQAIRSGRQACRI